MAIVVRQANANDYQSWQSLWNDYVASSANQPEDDVNHANWQRILSAQSSFFCLVAEVDNRVVGFALSVLHEGAWTTRLICYLENLYVDDKMRRCGIGRALLSALRAEGIANNWQEIHWITQASNPARGLYNKMATLTDYVNYSMAL
ncbi:hypothetical protein BL250_04970 [Erwinia sp. OLTSP20]|uniref:GNAT family N-acetyltransferase n=1 Tax=unclassified Erwinia TaxID=2622719 RepID=UPI000C199757|nr:MULTISPECIES: GNAT family N-acetyltransferase [unclassified Erwinia]PIJ50922.1 hypothetical protein BV501_06300 [Erwinia sp. OAMSP11]PIJ75950.1 hypothetical protein BK416_00210 [Erwinia sp. OLSSP12]PIJ83604.1 hypothetical protein BLD47_04125 [Erwinia sp. OLCASP19]PIJ87459.1 hypothetical protein BLD46_00495 [Erwinia sp. OLMTSP26]PIJ89008.1 hypothetical protein BLD49_00495 [Erwinia sp. OLMDSP33]